MTRRRRRNLGGPPQEIERVEPLAVDADEEWVIDLSGWKQGDRRQFGMAAQRGQTTGDIGELYKFLARAIKVWPFDLDPRDVKSYDRLDMEDFDEAVKRVIAAFPKAN